MYGLFSPEPGLYENTETVHVVGMLGRKPKVLDNPPNNLRKIRLERGLKLSDVANDLAMKSETLRRYETGERQVNIHLLKRFAEYYGVPQSEITGDPGALTSRERAVIEIFRGLSPDQQDTMYRLASAIAQPAALTAGPKRSS